MSRNSRKFNPEKQQNQEEKHKIPPQKQKNSSDNIFGLPFVTPTEIVELPSSGTFYPESSPMFGKRTIEIRHMTSKEEDLLSTGDKYEDSFKIYDLLIDALLVDKSINSSHMLEEDKLALLLNARCTGYGSEYHSMVYCANCKDQTKHIFDLSKSTIREPSIQSEYIPGEDLFSFVLPKSNIKVKIISSGEQIKEELEVEKKQKEKYNLPFNETVSFISKVVISANDVTDRSQISKLAEVLPAIDAKYIKEFFLSARPTLSTRQEVKCEVCGTQTEQEAPITWAFFRTDF
jgi:hypothetical protein